MRAVVIEIGDATAEEACDIVKYVGGRMETGATSGAIEALHWSIEDVPDE